jgi:hypothetical protein
MNCDAIQNALLGLLRPDQPPAAVQTHLAQCPVCRACQQRLLQLERQLPLLPVPPSNAKANLLRRLREEALAPPRQETIPFPGRPGESRGERVWKMRERAQQKLALAAALAAALMLFAVGWAVWQHQVHRRDTPEPASIETLVHRLRTREPALADDLARASTPKERVEILAQAAGRLLEQSRLLQFSADRDELATLADLYGEVLRGGLVSHARTLPPSQRAAVLKPILQQLQEAERDAKQRADSITGSANAASLQVIAAAAGEVRRRLNDLIEQAV